MKKVLVVFILLAVGVGIYFYMNRSDEVVTPANNNSDEPFRPDPSSATFTFDDGQVTLSQGRAEKSVAPGSALTEEIVLTDEVAYGDVNGDGEEDAVVLVLRAGGGSGSFIYVAALVSSNSSYRGSNAVFIGDRVEPSSVEIATNGNITVDYLDRDEDEPFAAQPTIPVSKTYRYRNGALEEI